MLFPQPLPGPQNYHGCWERHLDNKAGETPVYVLEMAPWAVSQLPSLPMHVWSLLQAETLGSSGLSTLKKKINQKVPPQQGNKSVMQSQGISTPPSCLSNELRGR